MFVNKYTRNELLSATEKGTLRVWNYETGLLLIDFEIHEGFINDLLLLSKDILLSVCDDDSTLKIWKF